MIPGLKVKALSNKNRVKEGTDGVTVKGPSNTDTSWAWVRFDGIYNLKLMRASELEIVVGSDYCF